MMKKKLFVAATVAAIGLAGCSGAKKEESKVLKVYAFKSAYGGENGETWKSVADGFTKMYPNIKVELVYAANIDETLKTQINAGENPDVIYYNQGQPSQFTEGLIKAKKLEDITGILNEKVPGEEVTVGAKLIDKVATSGSVSPYGDGKMYLAPIFATQPGLAYNSSLVGEGKKYAYPKTWDDFFKIAEEAKKDGISAFTYPTSGYLDSMIPIMIANNGGEELLTKVLNYEKDIYTNDQVKEVFETLGKVKDYTFDQTVTNAARDKGYLENQFAVMENKALLMPNGNWVAGEMESYNSKAAEGFKWAYGPIPTFKADGKQYVVNWVETAYTLKDSPNKEEAKKFLAYLYSDEAAKVFATKNGFQPIKDVNKFKSTEALTVSKLLTEGTQNITSTSFAATEAVPGLVWKDVLFSNVDNVFSGKKSVSEWLKELNEANNQLSDKLIK